VLCGTVFFLDIPDPLLRRTLAQQLSALAARVEMELSQDVTHVVTWRKPTSDQRKRLTQPGPPLPPDDPDRLLALAYHLGAKIYHADKFSAWLGRHCNLPTETDTSLQLIQQQQSPPQMTQHSTRKRRLPNDDENHHTDPRQHFSLPKKPRQQASPVSSSCRSLSTSPSPCTSRSHSPATSPSASSPIFHPYIMVEDLDGQMEKMYKEFRSHRDGSSSVPRINYDAAAGCSPFLASSCILPPSPSPCESTGNPAWPPLWDGARRFADGPPLWQPWTPLSDGSLAFTPQH